MPNLNGAGSMLIASLEGNGDICDIPLDGSQPTNELYTTNFLATRLGASDPLGIEGEMEFDDRRNTSF